jgi:hypothetical protein
MASERRRALPIAAGMLTLATVAALSMLAPRTDASLPAPGDQGRDGAGHASVTAPRPTIPDAAASDAAPATEGTPADARRRGSDTGEPAGSWQRDPLSRSAIEAGFVPGTARDDDPASVLTSAPREVTFPEPATITDEGFHVVAGTSSAGSGDTVRFTVEVDPDLGVDPEAVLDVIEDALYDERSWARTVRLERVEDPGDARIRVVLAHPDVVDELCGAAGLDTGGRYSCWTGAIAALNAWRWEVGADGFSELETYRRYLVNHEVGHGLGHGHVGCPEPGALAPVMMQQSISTGDCVANGWPFPEG